MPQLIELPTYSNESGLLTVFEKVLSTDVKRIFYIYGVSPNEQRGKHGHKKTWNALICVAGSCSVYVKSPDAEHTFELSNPAQCLVLEPQDWHIMENFSSDAVLLVASTEHYDKEDYIWERP
jgi:tellurite resistance-related uncharacterized protein